MIALDREDCVKVNLKDILDLVFSGVSSAATCTAVVVALHQAHRGERLNRQIVRMEIANGIKDKFQDQLTQSWEVLNDLRDLTSLTGRFG